MLNTKVFTVITFAITFWTTTDVVQGKYVYSPQTNPGAAREQPYHYCETDGYTFHPTTGSCYKLHIEYKTWDEANSTCTNEGGYLAVINNEQEAQIVIGVATSSFDAKYKPKWIGVRKVNGSWRSVFGDRIDQIFERWAMESLFDDGQECSVFTAYGMMYKVRCHSPFPFICEKRNDANTEPPSTPRITTEVIMTVTDLDRSTRPNNYKDSSEPTTGESSSKSAQASNDCGPGYTFYSSTESCYKVHQAQTSWDEANSTCTNEGGYLAVINGAHEAQILLDIPPTYNDFRAPKWIGYQKIDGYWLSVYGDPLPQMHDNGLNDGRECGAFTYSGSMQNVSCYSSFFFICEKRNGENNEPPSTPRITTEVTMRLTDLDRSTRPNNYKDSSEPTTGEASSESTLASTDCGSGYTFYSSTGSCYKVHQEQTSWDEANSTCTNEGGYLAVINGAHEAQILLDIPPTYNDFRAPKWIGYQKIDGYWLSVYGDPLPQMHDNGLNDGRECGAFTYSGSMQNVSCYSSFFFICEKRNGENNEPPSTPRITTEVTMRLTDLDRSTRPNNYKDSSEPTTGEASSESTLASTDCGSGYTYYSTTGSCYKVHKNEVSWDDANSTCSNEGGYLVVINNRGEADTINTLLHQLNDFPAWIGLRLTNGGWLSVHGDRLEHIFHEWSPYRSNDGRACGGFESGALLDDQHCNMHLAFICEKRFSRSKEETTDRVQVTTKRTTDCGSGYKLYSTGSCYKVHDEYKSWDDAQSTCSDEGGYLAVINNRNEAQILKRITKRSDDKYIRKWIGLRNIDGEWQSVRGDYINDIYKNWSRTLSGRPCGCFKTNGLLDDQKCRFRYRFICEKSKEEITTPTAPHAVSTPTPTHVATEIPDCGAGYTFYSTTGSCYKVHKEEVSWDDANSKCSEEGGYLVVINNRGEADTVNTLLHQLNDFPAWIGLRLTNGGWLSVHGDRLEHIYHEWSPYRSNDGRPCGGFESGALLDDQHCNMHLAFICEKSKDETTDVPPHVASPAPTHVPTETTNDCGSGYTLHSTTGSCYKVHKEEVSWDDANSKCSEEGGYLVVINNRGEADTVNTLLHQLNDFPAWIGLRLTNGGWHSVHGDRLENIYHEWSQYRSNDGRPCGGFESGALLDDQHCNMHLAFICEKSKEVTTDVPPHVASPAPTHVPTETADYCGSGYTLHSTTGSCYKVHKEEVSWDDANSKCSEEGGYLVVINNRGEADTVNTLLHQLNDFPAWIGLRLTNGGWHSVHGDRLENIYHEWSQYRSNDGRPCGGFESGALLDDQHCNMHLAFICEKSKEVTTDVPPHVASPAPTHVPTETTDYCGSGYTLHSTTGSCYKVHKEEVSWDDANSKCSEEGGYLVVINNRGEADTVNTLLHQLNDFPAWIGLRLTNGGWHSVHGDRLENIYHEWSQYRSNDGRPCGGFESGALLDDQHCNMHLAFICEKSKEETTDVPPHVASPAPTHVPTETTDYCGSGYTLHSTTGSCYKVHKEEVSWDDANSKCSEEGGYLVVINNRGEADTVNTLLHQLNDFPAWIGLRLTNGGWHSVHGDRLEHIYHEWSPYRSNDGRPCGGFESGALLDDQHCNMHLAFICEKSKDETSDVPPHVASPAPTHVTTETTDDCGSGYTFFSTTGSCYKVHKEEVSWDEAYSKCSEEGGYLVVINDSHEALTINKLLHQLNDFPAWIGLRLTNGGWLSVHGDRLEHIFHEWSPYRSNDGRACGDFKSAALLDDQHCNMHLAFICEKSKDETTDVPPHVASPAPTHVTTETTDDCGSGYTFYSTTGSCYKVHKEEVSWDDANSKCSEEGGYLVVINDSHEALTINTLLHQLNDFPAWIGLRLTNGGWHSVHGDRLEHIFHEWSPYRSNDGRPCGGFESGALLDDQHCNMHLAFICEKSKDETTDVPPHVASPAPTHVTTETTDYCGSGYTFFSTTGSCYKVHKEEVSWDEANSKCSEEGGYLVVINDSHEALTINTLLHQLNDFPAWIGLRLTNDGWLSVHGDRLEHIFHEWSPYRSNDGRACGDFKSAALLDDQHCNMHLAFICEKSKDETTDVPPHVASPAPTHVTTETTDYCGSGYTFFSTTGSCYKVHKEEVSWDDANSKCSEEGGYLVVINDSHEALTINTLLHQLNDFPAWIGLRLTNGGWLSVHGDRLEHIFHEWSPYRSNDGRACGDFKSAALLDDQHCNMHLAFICEKR